MECGAHTLLLGSVGPGHLHLTAWSMCDLSPESPCNCLLWGESLPRCFHLVIQIHFGLPFRPLIVWPHKNCSPISWGDSFTMCSLGQSPGLANGSLGFSSTQLWHQANHLTPPCLFPPEQTWTDMGGRTTWTSKILSSCNVGGTKSCRWQS